MPESLTSTLDSGRWFAPDAGRNYLHYAATNGEPRAVRAFIDAGAPLHVRDDRGWTALHHATSQIDIEALTALLAGRADPEVRNNHGETALHVANRRRGGEPALAALLEAGAFRDFLPTFHRTVQTTGAKIDKWFYFAPVLRQWTNATDPDKPEKKRKFAFRRDPRDVSRVWFLDPETEQYFDVPTTDQSMPRG